LGGGGPGGGTKSAIGAGMKRTPTLRKRCLGPGGEVKRKVKRKAVRRNSRQLSQADLGGVIGELMTPQPHLQIDQSGLGVRRSQVEIRMSPAGYGNIPQLVIYHLCYLCHLKI
jgi:hypothetical protein